MGHVADWCISIMLSGNMLAIFSGHAPTYQHSPVSCVRLPEGGLHVVYPFDTCSPASLELSRSAKAMAK